MQSNKTKEIKTESTAELKESPLNRFYLTTSIHLNDVEDLELWDMYGNQTIQCMKIEPKEKTRQVSIFINSVKDLTRIRNLITKHLKALENVDAKTLTIEKANCPNCNHGIEITIEDGRVEGVA